MAADNRRHFMAADNPYLPRTHRVMYFLIILGFIFLVPSSIEDYNLKSRESTFVRSTSVEGRLDEVTLRMSDLERTISAGSSRIFGGLCLVAAAIIFAAGSRRVAYESGTTAERTQG